jgi:DNA repair protein RadC
MNTFNPKEYKVVALRECPLPEDLKICDTPEKVVEYWNAHLLAHPYFNPECECFVTLLLNTRRRIKGHCLISIGTLDSVVVHPRDVFRPAVVAAAAGIILVHNHPSGEATPSTADIQVTNELVRAGQILRIEVVDHVVIGRGEHRSLRAMGHLN